MSIKLLSDNTINKIAAGEVIERPLSVLRELIDNALDANSTRIRVEILDGGKRLLKVSDNGDGIDADQISVAFQRHATSKIREADDLNTICSLGFRGEALSSIAAVSRVVLRSRTQHEELGAQIEIHGGELISQEAVSSRIGTEIEVANLFFNTPARKKFLRAARTEQKRMKQHLTDMALAWPQCAFEFVSDGKELLNLPSCQDSDQRGEQIFGREFSVAKLEQHGMGVRGLLSHPSQAKFDRSAFTFLVNARPVQDRMLLRALRDGYDSMLKAQEYPQGFLDLRLPPFLVDVNVHPQKSEVRFSESSAVYRLVRNAVREAVGRFGIQNVSVSGTQDFSSDELLSPVPAQETQSESPTTTSFEGETRQAGLNFNASPAAENPQASLEFDYSELRYLGQLFSCYLLFSRLNRFYLLDMHAAHERINFNILKERFSRNRSSKVPLLFSQSIRLSPERYENILANQEFFDALGFEFESFGDQTLLVRTVPEFLIDTDLEALFQELSDFEIVESAAELLEEKQDHMIARIACHASIRSGKSMKREEVFALLSSLAEAEMGSACPHGRPVFISFSEGEVERWFGRDR